MRKILFHFGQNCIADPDEVEASAVYELPLDLNALRSACALTEDEALTALDRLMTMHFVHRETDTGYCLNRSKVAYAAAALRALERMCSAEYAWGCPNGKALRVGFITE